MHSGKVMVKVLKSVDIKAESILTFATFLCSLKLRTKQVLYCVKLMYIFCYCYNL